MQFYIAQGIGFVGMVLGFLTFQQNEKRKILLIQACACVMFSLHFFMLGAFTGMAMNLLEILRNFVFAQKHGKRRQLFLTICFVSAFIILGIIIWESQISLFPIVAMSLSTTAFSLQNPRNIRFCTLPASALWMTYNIFAFSLAGVLTETFCLLSVFIAMLRFDILKKTKNKF